MADYRLKCMACGREYADENFRLRCDDDLNGAHGPALLRPVYGVRQIEDRPELPGVFRYADWLPTGRNVLAPKNRQLGQPICFRSMGLGKRLGLKNLFVAFSGYWPERGASLITRTFKELEAQVSMARYFNIFHEHGALPPAISSAGNSANGYNLLGHILNVPVYIFVPMTGLDKLTLPFKTDPFAIAVDGDYSDAIELCDQVSAQVGFIRDGGVLNVGRRSGMGTSMLNAVLHPEQGAGRLFDHYFQAVGSASGAIAAWEMVELLRQDGRFGDTKTHIHMAQNIPFTPIPDAWSAGSGDLLDVDDALVRERVNAVTARVLTNRKPPYAVAGGIYDTLKESGGAAWRVNNYRLFHAARMFRSVEGIDIGEAGAVAVDALRQAVEQGAVSRDEYVLLHITGGGKEIQFTHGETYQVEPKIVVSPGEADRVVEFFGDVQRLDMHECGLTPY